MNKVGSKITVQCKQCNASITKYPSLLTKRKYGNFCNKDCLGLFRSKHLTGTLAANFQNIGSHDRKYVLVLAPWHPNKIHNNYIYVHRLIMEAKLGRFLLETEVVHHKDGNAENNHWNNLEILTQAEHAALHMEERLKQEEFLKQNIKEKNNG